MTPTFYKKWWDSEWAKTLFDGHKHPGVHPGDTPSWPWWAHDIGNKVALLLEDAKEEGYKLCAKDMKDDAKVQYQLGLEEGRKTKNV